jgi:hypothetical protein
VLDGIGEDRSQPRGVACPTEIVLERPTGVRVRGLDPNPLAALLEHPQRFALQGLCQLLGLLGRVGAQRREVASERMFA